MINKAIVYIQTGCPACEEYLPRIQAAARARKLPLAVVNVSFPSGAQKAEQHSIRSTPTSDFVTERGTVVRRVGSLPESALDKLLG